MTARQLEASDSTPTPDGQQDPAIQVNIRDPKAKQEIREAIRSFGFGKVGTGVRLVLLTFARSEEVQRSVRKQLGVHAPTPVGER